MRLEAVGAYDFSYLRFVREPQDGDEAEQPTGSWRPAAGRFEGWPRKAADLRVFDPCCGSGHFLIECLDLLVRLRMEEERLAPGTAIDAVLRDNLFGLEIDPRCTQIAAFNLALTAWTWPDAGDYRRLPDLNLACSGLAPNVPRDEWTRLSDDAADAGGLPPKRDLLGVEDTLMSAPLRNGLGALHDLFAQAPVLGSLIDPRTVEADLFQHDYESMRVLLGTLLERERGSNEQTERAVAAQGMARAAELLAGRYHLVITNVPYLGRRDQALALKQFTQERHSWAKADLATVFVSRNFGWLDKHGVQAAVTPQNWLFLTSYRKLREKLLKQHTWNLVARLGSGAFETISGNVVNVALSVLSADRPTHSWRMAGIDVSVPLSEQSVRPVEKASLLRGVLATRDPAHSIQTNVQGEQLRNPDARVVLGRARGADTLAKYAQSFQGTTSGDNPRFVLTFWETSCINGVWRTLQSTGDGKEHFAGRHHVFLWENGNGCVVSSQGARIQGRAAWDKLGIAVGQMEDLPATLNSGSPWDMNCATIVPKDSKHLSAVWCFCSSSTYNQAVRRIDQHLKVTNATLVKVPFDLSYWQRVADEEYPHGLPKPFSDDPTQWIFHGHPCGSVGWDDGTKRTTHGPSRIDAAVLHVAVARLLGHRWPAEHAPDMRLADEVRTWADRCKSLGTFADADGIVCLAPVSGEQAAADRLRLLLAAAYGDEWSAATERRLLVAAAANGQPAESMEEWLRDRFFEEHCRLFHQRPFVWHVWDGRRDGFHALVHYHRLAGPDGESRRTLEALTYRHLGDWIARLQADREQGVEGVDGRLAAAQDLQGRLEEIAAGDPPCDLFARWKPLAEQPIGWEPDINDGVRINVRPFMSAELSKGGRVGAGILRIRPKIKWSKDRGREPSSLRPQDEYPWFWGCPGDGTQTERTNFRGGPDFDGNRWNDLHYTNAVKRAARSRSMGEADS